MSGLHLTKVAFGCTSLAMLDAAIARRAVGGTVLMTTRYLPKRHVEILDGGSLYWIIKHQLVARAKVLRFEPNAEGRQDMILEARVVPVAIYPKRAHQGWRYLNGNDAPPDLGEGISGGDDLPPELLGELAGLSLI